MIRSVVVVAFLFASLGLRAQLQFDIVPQPVVERRLAQFGGNDTKREATLKALFAEAGCKDTHLSEQTVPRRAQPNVWCVLPGATDEVVIVGAHFDHVDAGSGVADNWSGASLLPSLYSALAGVPRQRTYWFVGFTGEEEGTIGSDYFASQLTREQLSRVRVMIALDTLGLGPTEVWPQQSDPARVTLLARVAKAMQVPLTGIDLKGAGESDEESFIARGVCSMLVHSVTPSTFSILHNARDNAAAIHKDDYFTSYRLMAAFLAALDQEKLPANHACTVQPVPMYTGGKGALGEKKSR